MNHKEEVTVWIALTPASYENGCHFFLVRKQVINYIPGTLEYARGSHKWPIKTVITQDVSDFGILSLRVLI